MIPKDNLLLQAKTDVYHRLLGDDFLSNVPILIDDERDLDNREAVARGAGNSRNGKTGACIVVATLASDRLSTGETPTPVMDLAVVIECLEDVLVNAGPDGTGINAGELVARCVQLLHLSHFDDRFTGLRFDDRGGLAELLTNDAGLRGYAVRFVAGFAVAPTCAPVSATFDAGLCSLACATPDASIYYTMDGSYPGSGNPEADLYLDPFPVSPGGEVRAAAQKEGCNASKIVLVHAAPA
ncbi:MAG TPA: chitobiase/beta-hexosaminidase C-terminal domain-containing protein [Bacteroidia bacterium]|nr:chitobiase/beta-hexosaminidase C-terminal domain-containing protein [Bacteroidia bacterium]